MSQQKQKMLQLELVTNGGERIVIEHKNWDGRDGAVADFVAKWMKKLGHPARFSSEDLRTAEWMPTQSEILHKTGFCSLRELSEQAERAYRYMIHGGGYKQSRTTA